MLHAYSEPLRLENRPDPTTSADEALVRVRAVGICGTDIKIWSGAFGTRTKLPIILGHEIAGELAEAVDGLGEGRRVACYFYETCNSCRWCRSGRSTLCPYSVRLGFERDGGLAEYVVVPRPNLLPFDEALSFGAAAVAMDAVTTPWSALHGKARLQAGERVLVVGAGGLGLNGVQIAKSAGARVAVAEPEEAQREAALAVGAELAVTPNCVREVQTWSSGGVDLALDTSGSSSGFEAAAAALRPGGRVVCCGYHPGVDYQVDSARLVLDELQVVGSRSATLSEASAALRAVEAGVVHPRIMDRLPLDQVNDAFERLREGKVVGRIVVEV